MSVNGLDKPEVQQAFEYACAEAGWFFLKYESRDELELLGKGNNSVREMKELVQKEPDDSPLYGFIRYRRRNILIKLVPDNTSRVLKARSQVHFNYIVERFTPCDVTVSLTSARELTDAALTTACSTHTATASISSSSSSLRQRRLTDIVESAEEGQESGTQEGQKSGETTTVNSQGLQVVVTTHESEVGRDGTRGPIAVEISRPEPIKIEESIELEDEIVTKYADIDDAKTNPSTTPQKRDTPETLRRKSTSSARPPPNEIYDYLYKPKVKLGPRPSTDWDRRPHTSGASSKGFSSGSGESRPVASVPKSIHIPPRKLSSHRSSNSKHAADSSTNNPVVIVPPTPPLPLQPAAAGTLTTPSTYSPILLSPTLSIASVRSTKSSSGLSSKQPTITPEKARLLKALELRKKAMNSKAEAQAKAEAEEASRQQQILGQQKEEEERKNKGELAHPEKFNDKVFTSTIEDEKMNTTDHDNLNCTIDNKDTSNKNSSNINLSNPNSHNNGSNHNNNDRDDGNYYKADEFAEDESVTPIPSTPPRSSESAQDVPDTQNPIIEVGLEGEPANSFGTPEHQDDPLSSISEDDNASLSQSDTNSTFDTIAPCEGLARMKSEPSSPRSASTSDLTEGKENKQLRRVGTSPHSLAQAARKSFSQKARTNHTRLPSTEVPVIETARSVSAPFLGGKPSDTKPVLLSPRKVNVSAGSVSQRIRQLEMLSKSKQQAPAPALTPPRSRPSSPNPAAALPSLRTAGMKSPSSTNVSATSSSTVTPHKIESPFLAAGFNPPEKSPEFLLPNHGPEERIRKLSSPEMSPVSFRKNSISEMLTPKSPPTSNGMPAEESKPIPTVPRPRSKSSAATARKNSVTQVSHPPLPSKPAVVEKSVLLMGWVNVQLPDAIIWKRRCLKIVSDGWLFLSLTEDENAPQTRKWSIPQDVSRIVIPDPDEEELPHSVHVLLKEGGILQCACQDPQEQGEVFKIAQSCLKV